MLPPKLITFDCYGTLIDWYGGLRGTLSHLLPDGDLDGLWHRYVELERKLESGPYRSYRKIMADTLAALLEEAGTQLPASERDALGQALPGWKPYPEVRAMLLRLQRDYALGILSNIDDDLLDSSLVQLGVTPTHRVTASQVHAYKPDEAHFRRILEISGLPAEEILHVAGSLLHDMVPACELGFRHLWVNRLREPRPAWLSATREVSDLTALPTMAHRIGA